MRNNKTNRMIWMDVMNMEQAKIAAGAGAGAGTVMGLEKIPTDMHWKGRVAPTSVPAMSLGIENAAAKNHIGHFVKQIMRD
mmetsp:Transcript_5114/g.7469  ORF Transcript_5114/g.7469 Transcript_5114/m.7469 type:complete len:81 (+) Transcript_5114:2-244(+)